MRGEFRTYRRGAGAPRTWSGRKVAVELPGRLAEEEEKGVPDRLGRAGGLLSPGVRSRTWTGVLDDEPEDVTHPMVQCGAKGGSMSDAVHLGSGKVRELYALDDERLLLVASDRISTFDVILPTEIPDKGRVLTGLSAFWFARTSSIVPNHLLGLQA